MAYSRAEILAGGVVFAAAVGFAIYVTQLTGVGTGTGDAYHLRASFRSLEGVSLGSEVRLAGVRVGAVSDITLNPETYRADTIIAVQKGIEVPDDSAIVIASEGLLGGNYVEIVPGGSPFYYGDGDEVADTQGAVSLISLLMKWVGSAGE